MTNEQVKYRFLDWVDMNWSRMTHAMAGKPSHLNIVGAEWGCLPCAEIRANGRGELFYRLKRMLADRIRSRSPITPETILGYMESWEEERLRTRIKAAMESGAVQPNDQGQRTSDQ